MPDTDAQASSSTAPNAGHGSITFVNRQLNIKPFITDRDSTETASRWDKWKKNIERQFRFFGISDPELKKDGLIIYGGEDIAELEESLPDTTSGEENDCYKILIQKLDHHFLPKKNKDYARFQMGNLTQEIGEPLARYHARIREIAKKCDYNDENEAIRDHLIKTIRNKRIRIKAIRNNWTLQQILDEAAIDEEANQQAREMEKKLEDKRTEQIRRIGKHKTNTPGKPASQQACDRCGRNHDHRNQCKAIGATCHSCGKKNHYSTVCRSKQAPQNPIQRGKPRFGERKQPMRPRGEFTTQRQQIRQVLRNNNDSDSESSLSSDECFLDHLSIKKASQGIQKTCAIFINGLETIIEPDTGADTNIMDEKQFHNLQTHRPEIKLHKSNVKLKALTHDLKIKGECTVQLENQTRRCEAKIVVIEGTMDSLPLLGRPTLGELGMLKIDPTGGLRKPNKAVKHLHSRSTELNNLLQKHQNLFLGIRRATRNGEESRFTCQ